MFLNYRDSYLAISWQKYATIDFPLFLGSVSRYGTVSGDPGSPGTQPYPGTSSLQVRNRTWRQSYPVTVDIFRSAVTSVYTDHSLHFHLFIYFGSLKES